ncbi:MAG: class I SAM-dependent methyltransferase [Oscillospiraceae bacterium]|jgi:SAM-dependent methyltransferase|nr:class I SAM-dependent methyltransferase [Oscillospiraceae bacterium]
MKKVLIKTKYFFSSNRKQRDAKSYLDSGYASTLSRIEKARLIKSVLTVSMDLELSNMNILDVGCGNGEISQFLQNYGNNVASCDVQIPSIELSNFIKLTDITLPFGDDSFDIVIYNNVIEHLSSYNDQKIQLHEIYRVLKSDGCAYINAPNRLFPMEAHTGVWFLHWLPNHLFFLLLKLIKRYQEDILLINYFKFKRIIKQIGFQYDEYTADIIAYPDVYSTKENTIKLKCKKSTKRAGFLYKILQPLSPNNVFIVRKGI